jgi:TonB family protein
MVVSARDLLKDKELTYLQLPPDEQKVSKRPDTNNVSDKDRIATSRAPRLDREELKKILDASRPGAPGPGGQQSPALPPAAPSPATAQGSQVPEPSAPKPAVSQNQTAQLQTPPRPSFSNSMSAGSAIEQAARAAIANRGGGGYSGDGGNYGLGQGQQAQALGPMEILSDTMGVDFGPYLARVVHDVRENWYRLIPESAQAPIMKKGKVAIEFAITKDGTVAGMTLTGPSGDVALDRAAWGGITASNPFPPLPQEFRGQYLALRFRFYYNPDKNEMQ